MCYTSGFLRKPQKFNKIYKLIHKSSVRFWILRKPPLYNLHQLISFRLQIHKVCDIFDNKTYHYFSALLFRSDSYLGGGGVFFAQIFLSMTLNLTAISCQTLHLRSLFFQVQGHFMHKEPNFLGLFGTKHHLLWDPYICICILFWGVSRAS